MRKEGQILAIFLVMAGVIAFSILLIYQRGQTTLRLSHLVEVHFHASHALEKTLSIIKDAETGQRGYLITGKEEYLAPYQSALLELVENRAQLQTLVDQNVILQTELDSLNLLIDRRLSILKENLILRRTEGFEAVSSRIKKDNGKHAMDAIRAKAESLIATQESKATRAREAVERNARYRTAVFAIVLGINLLFLVWAYRKIRREMQRRQIITAEVRRQKNLLAVTLASIGDAVIVTDVNGLVTYLNKVAEKLTGWKLEEAMGRPCAEVFRIINEDSRDIVESPVEKVLKTGTVVGLANHTLLIGKDGSETPIDDSGAPIKEQDGTLHGVVLVFRDFSEYKKSELQLRNAKNELETANKAKDQFLATLSHELRTPLTPVLAILTGWEASHELPAELVSDIHVLRRNVDLEARLIDDLLDLTSIVKGKMSLNHEIADIHELINAAINIYKTEIAAKNITLTMNLNAGLHYVNGDPARLEQAFWNIVKNAMKFTPDGGRMEVKTRNIDSNIEITFIDNGIGMTEDTLLRLFHPFEQGADDFIRRYGGLGMGMAICKALVNAHNGSIEAKSQGRGLGSTFTIVLPTVPTSNNHLASAAPGSKEDNTPPVHFKILLVEDHEDTARVLARSLKRLGHEVQTCDSVSRAVELVQQYEFDLLLSDIGLPDGTGIDLIRRVRSHYKNPAFALTGFGMENDIAECLAAGFNAHLTKPVNFHRLQSLIKEMKN